MDPGFAGWEGQTTTQAYKGSPGAESGVEGILCHPETEDVLFVFIRTSSQNWVGLKCGAGLWGDFLAKWVRVKVNVRARFRVRVRLMANRSSNPKFLTHLALSWISPLRDVKQKSHKTWQNCTLQFPQHFLLTFYSS